MLLATYEATQEAVLVVDPNGNVVAANHHLGAFFGLDSNSLPGMPVANLEEPIVRCFENPVEFRAEWASLAADPNAYVEADWELVEPEPRSLSIYSAPVSRPRGGALCAAVDVP